MKINSIHFFYQILNTKTGESYIGLTNDFTRRIYDHLTALTENRHINEKLQKGFNLYGLNCFSIQVLETHYNIEDIQASQVERELIKKHDSFSNGYNKSSGGEITSNLKTLNVQEIRDIYSICQNLSTSKALLARYFGKGETTIRRIANKEAYYQILSTNIPTLEESLSRHEGLLEMFLEEKGNNQKLTNFTALAIYLYKLADYAISLDKVALELDIDRSTLYNIAKGSCYSHVEKFYNSLPPLYQTKLREQALGFYDRKRVESSLKQNSPLCESEVIAILYYIEKFKNTKKIYECIPRADRNISKILNGETFKYVHDKINRIVENRKIDCLLNSVFIKLSTQETKALLAIKEKFADMEQEKIDKYETMEESDKEVLLVMILQDNGVSIAQTVDLLNISKGRVSYLRKTKTKASLKKALREKFTSEEMKIIYESL